MQEQKTNLKTAVLRKELDENTLQLEVSACSWAYPLYGLQVKITLAGGGCAYIHKKELVFADATLGDLERILDSVKLCKCPTCGKAAFDPSTVETNRNGLCEKCFMITLKAEYEAAIKDETDTMAKQDAEHKNAGFTHRINAWVHSVGDDQEVCLYMITPTNADIQRELKRVGSCVLNDYSIKPL